MNKTIINDLISRSTESYRYTDIDGDNNHGKQVNTEKLIELVVRECTKVIKIGGSFLHDESPEAKFSKEVTDAINRHFGIKQ